MNNILNAIWENIAGIIITAFFVFLIWSMGYILVQDMKQIDKMYETCIAANMQWIDRNCVR